MIRAHGRVLLIVIAAMAAAAVYGFARRAPSPLPERPAAERPALLLLTSLPLIFGEQFSINGGSPALKALGTRYRVIPISVTDQADLAKGKLLLMAHPSAQPAEDLVALDEWVRNGGRLLLLADPMLEWPSERPLGDTLRPPPMFMDTGLLAHWGLRLDAPDDRGAAKRELAGRGILTISPGRLAGECRISRDRLVAHCDIGKGRATIVADADFLRGASLGRDAQRNFEGLLGELARLEAK